MGNDMTKVSDVLFEIIAQKSLSQIGHSIFKSAFIDADIQSNGIIIFYAKVNTNITKLIDTEFNNQFDKFGINYISYGWLTDKTIKVTCKVKNDKSK